MDVKSYYIYFSIRLDTVRNICFDFQLSGGFFIECGALDGERSSNTIYLEQMYGWTGLLIEADPYFYTQLMGKNRKAWSINTCLSPGTQIQWVGMFSTTTTAFYTHCEL